MPDRRRMSQFVREWALLAQGVILVAAIGGSWWWPLDLPNHFLPFFAFLALVGTAAAVYDRAPRTAVALGIALACLVIQLMPERPFPAPTDGVPLRLMVVNVHTSNTDHRAVLDLVRAENPDVVGFLEVNARWVAALSELRLDRPFLIEHPREDNFGIALYSRVPLADLDVTHLTSASVPSAVAQIHGATLVLTHPLPPNGRDYTQLRDDQLAMLAARRADDRAIIAGDLNVTPWSSAFPGRRPGLRPGTWPAFAPALLRIPIDHVLVGPAVRLERLRVGPDVGSDHLPLIADLVVPAVLVPDP